MNQPSKKTIKICGSQVSYFVYNPKAKATIVMIHGFRGDHHGLQFIAQKLSNFRVIVPDLPGFGQSTPMSRGHDIAGYVAFLDKFIDSIKLDKPPILLGHSFGSIVCASFAAKNPHKISKLILVNPIAESALGNSNLAWLANTYYWLGQKLPKKHGTKLLKSRTIVRAMSHSLAKTKNKDLLKLIHSQHLKYFSNFHNRKNLHEAYQASISNQVIDWATELKMPVLLIVGEKDNIASLDSQKRLQQKIVDRKLVIIPETGHLVHYETPNLAAKEIIKFSLN